VGFARIAGMRAAGRKAGRLIGYKIATTQSDPHAREDGRVVVVVAVREAPNEEENQRMRDRADLLLGHHFDEVMGRAGRGAGTWPRLLGQAPGLLEG